jgi:hypothetical protein
MRAIGATVVMLLVLTGCAGVPEPATWPRVPGDESEDMPPIARLLLPDGTATPGTLGSFAYRESYADAPWLPAAALEPVDLPAGRPALVIGVLPGRQFERWNAIYAAANDPAADVLVPLAAGQGDPRERVEISSPPSGEWVVQVQLVFAEGDGDAVYYWRVDVP